MQILIQTESRGSTDTLVGIAEIWLRQKGYVTRVIRPAAGTRNMGRTIGESADEPKWADQRIRKMFHPITTETERDDSGALQKALIDATGPEDRPNVMITVFDGITVPRGTPGRPDTPQTVVYRYRYRSLWPESQIEVNGRGGSFPDLPGYPEDEFRIRINEFLDGLPVR